MMTEHDPASGAKGSGGKSGHRSRDAGELAALGRRIDAAQARRKPDDRDGGRPGQGAALGFAFRIASELAAGVGLGTLVGWWLDRWLGTKPVLLIVMLLLGVAGGIWNVLRTAERMHRLGTGATGGGSSPPDDREKMR